MANIKIGTKVCNNCKYWNCDEGQYGYDERVFKLSEVCTKVNCAQCLKSKVWKDATDSCPCFEHMPEKRNPGKTFMNAVLEFARNSQQIDEAHSEAKRLITPTNEEINLNGEAEHEFANDMEELKRANDRARELVKEGMAPEFMFKDKAVDFMHLLDRAKNGNRNAQYEFACAFWNGAHGARDAASLEATNDQEIPRYWCRKAAENGLVEAQYRMGHSGWDGDEKSIEWLKKAADQGHAEARKEFQELADRIASNSRELLSKCITTLKQETGDGDAKAISYIREASSALNHSEEWKDSVPLYKLDQKFVDDFINSIEDVVPLRSSELQNAIGMMFEGGYSSFKYIVKKDGERAVRWFKQAAEAGCSDAMDNLGVCFANGVGVEKDDKIAADWYRKAAQAGLAWGQYHYACRLISGEGIEKDIDSGREWLQKASAQGLRKAKDRLDVLDDECDADNPLSALRAGWKLRKKRDYSSAFRYFKKAEAAGLPEAKFALAKCYYFGDGVEEDKKLAVKFWLYSRFSGWDMSMNEMARRPGLIPRLRFGGARGRPGTPPRRMHFVV